MKRVVITGANGMLASCLAQTLNRDFEVKNWSRLNGFGSSPWIRGINFHDLNDVRNAFREDAPDVVIHCAAITDVDYCEDNRDDAYQSNFVITRNLADLCQEHGALFLFISTDYVFDGSKGPYLETAEVNPINYYGWTKAKAEQYITENLKQYLILRTTVLVNGTGPHKNFMLWVLNNLEQGKSVSAFTDQYGNPTTIHQFSISVAELLKQSLRSGIYHLTGREWMNRYTLAQEIAKRFGYPCSMIVPVLSSDIKQKAKRPEMGGFIVDKVSTYLPDNYLDFLKGEMEKA